MSDSLVQSDPDSSEMPKPCSQELKPASKASHNLLVIDQESTIGELMPCEKFNDLRKLFRVTAYVLRAVNLFKAKKGARSHSALTLTPQELTTAGSLMSRRI